MTDQLIQPRCRRQRPMTGIVLAAKLQLEEVPMIVFVTAYDRYAVQAFELNAVDYLLKPVDGERFRATINRVRARVGQQLTPSLRGEMSRAVASVSKYVDGNRPSADQDRLVLEVEGRVYFVDPAEVEHVEVDGNYSCIRRLPARAFCCCSSWCWATGATSCCCCSISRSPSSVACWPSTCPACSAIRARAG